MIGKLLHLDLAPKADASPESVAFLQRVQWIRNLDRLALVGVFILFCVLVHRAWARRHREGATIS
jgi:hypothetical protein